MAEYKNVGNHAEDLADGRMIAPGEVAELDPDQVKEYRNADLIETGTLILISGDPSAETTEGAEATAARLGVDLGEVKGTGRDGRITQADVEAFAKSREES